MDVISDLMNRAKADLQAIEAKKQAVERHLAALGSARDDLQAQVNDLHAQISEQTVAVRAAREEAQRVRDQAHADAHTLHETANAKFRKDKADHEEQIASMAASASEHLHNMRATIAETHKELTRAHDEHRELVAQMAALKQQAAVIANS